MKKLNIKIIMSLMLAALMISGCSDDEDTGQFYQDNFRDLTVRQYIESGSNNTAGNAKYTTLYAALVKANLLASLEGEVTLLAPTNAAFDAAGIVIDDMSPEELTEVLSYHVISGQVTNEALAGAVTSVEGSALFATAGCINGVATIQDADISVSNGLVHEIDAVLMPPTGDIIDKVGEYASGATPEFTLLQSAVVKAGLDGALSSNSRFTVFAPTDAAFTAAGLDQTAIDAATPEELAEILEFHVLAGESFSCALETGRFATIAGSLDQVQGVDISTAEGVSVNGASVTSANVLASNGVIHVVDAVIFPEPSLIEALGPEVDITASLGPFDFVFDPMYAAVVRLGYDQTFLGDLEAEYSVYAPCCGSFSEASYPTDEALAEVVDAHIFEGIVDIEAVAAEGGARIESISGAKYFVTTSDNGVWVNGSTENAFGATAGFTFPVYNGFLYTTFPTLNPLPEENVVEQLKADASYDLFGTALELAGLGASGDVTVFALDNATFTANFGYSTTADLDTLAEGEEDDLETLAAFEEALATHVVSGVYFIVDIDDGSLPSFVASTGDELGLAYRGADIIFLVDLNDIDVSPVMTGFDVVIGANGIVHEVDRPIEP
ncbi:MAG: fasciclin domain-containing protein [Fulvivirga sp.]